MLVKDDIICPKCGGMTPDYLRYNRRRLGVSVHWACCCGPTPETCHDCGGCSFSNLSTVTVTWTYHNLIDSFGNCFCTENAWVTNTLTFAYSSSSGSATTWTFAGALPGDTCGEYTVNAEVAYSCATNQWGIFMQTVPTDHQWISVQTLAGDCSGATVTGTVSGPSNNTGCSDPGVSTLDLTITVNDNETCAGHLLLDCDETNTDDLWIATSNLPSGAWIGDSMRYDGKCYELGPTIRTSAGYTEVSAGVTLEPLCCECVNCPDERTPSSVSVTISGVTHRGCFFCASGGGDYKTQGADGAGTNGVHAMTAYNSCIWIGPRHANATTVQCSDAGCITCGSPSSMNLRLMLFRLNSTQWLLRYQRETFIPDIYASFATFNATVTGSCEDNFVVSNDFTAGDCTDPNGNYSWGYGGTATVSLSF